MLSMVMFSHIVPVNLHRRHGNHVCEVAGAWVAWARGFLVLVDQLCTSSQCMATNTNFCNTCVDV
jgi:hypothetical protein